MKSTVGLILACLISALIGLAGYQLFGMYGLIITCPLALLVGAICQIIFDDD